MAEFPRISEAGWTPNDDDILRCRNPTKGVNEVDFELGNTGHVIRYFSFGTRVPKVSFVNIVCK
jgi:hypothetical protein